jgi:hypothetical protein
MSSPIIVMRGIVKKFGGTCAVNQVDFDVRLGEVHALPRQPRISRLRKRMARCRRRSCAIRKPSSAG